MTLAPSDAGPVPAGGGADRAIRPSRADPAGGGADRAIRPSRADPAGGGADRAIRPSRADPAGGGTDTALRPSRADPAGGGTDTAIRPSGADPAGGGTDTGLLPAGVRPREGGRTRPALARLMDRRPHPTMRRLADVLAERAAQRRPVDEAPRVTLPDAPTPAWEAALAGARSQVGPVALRVLAAVAEVLDGRRPPEHLGRIGPPGVVEQVRAAATGPGLPRGARVRGLRMCPVLAPVAGGTPVLAVEVAAALCAPGPDDRPPPRARAVAARFELGTDRTTWRLTELLVV